MPPTEYTPIYDGFENQIGVLTASELRRAQERMHPKTKEELRKANRELQETIDALRARLSK